MDNIDKLGMVFESYLAGDYEKMVGQVKKYGVNKFMMDFFHFIKGKGTGGKVDYALVVYTYHLYNQKDK